MRNSATDCNKVEAKRRKPTTKTRKKAAVVFPESSLEDVIIDLGKDNLFDDKECTWLSLDCGSPLSSFLEEYRFSTSSLSTWKNSFLYLDEETRNDVANFSPASPDSARSCLEDPLISDSSQTPTSTTSSCQIPDFDRLSSSVSLLNLDDDEDSLSISDSELEYFESGFPSPSWKENWGSKTGQKKPEPSGNNNCSDHNDMEEFDIDHGPLFWPKELQKFDWSSEESWKLFSMSPRKYTIKLGTSTPPGSCPQPKIQPGTVESKQKCSRRLVFSSGCTASKVLERRQRNANNSRNRIDKKLSRLRKSNETSVDNDGKEANWSIPEVKHMTRQVQEDDFESQAEVPIETLLGLREFDGHEGVDSEFNQEIFTLDDSL